jgi:hypothetical protein
MKEESCVAKLDLGWFSVSYGGVCLGVLGWRDYEVSFGKYEVSLI